MKNLEYEKLGTAFRPIPFFMMVERFEKMVAKLNMVLDKFKEKGFFTLMSSSIYENDIVVISKLKQAGEYFLIVDSLTLQAMSRTGYVKLDFHPMITEDAKLYLEGLGFIVDYHVQFGSLLISLPLTAFISDN